MSGININLGKDGRLEGRVPMEKDPRGRRGYRAFFSRSREVLTEKIAVFRRNLAGEKNVSATFAEIFGEWYEDISRRIKESTAANYRMKGQKHLLPFFGGMRLDRIGQGDIYAFIEQKKKQGLSDRYIADNLTLLKTVFRHAQKKYHMANPVDGITFRPAKRKEAVLLEECQQDGLSVYLREHPDRTSLGIALCRTTGLRIGELCALRWEDIDLEKRNLTVRHTLQRVQVKNGENKTRLVLGKAKTASSQRVVPLPEALLPGLLRCRGKEGEFLLSGTEKPIEPRVMQYRFAKILKKTGLPSVRFHALRHMFATDCIRLGMDMKSLSELLGHSRIETTMNLYVHSSLERKREFMNRLAV